MMRLLFLDNVRSEMGYGLDDTIPNHSVLGFSQQSYHQGPFGLRSSRVSIS